MNICNIQVPYLSGLIYSGYDRDNWDKHNGPGIVVVFIGKPEGTAKHLEYVERRQDLFTY